MSSHGGALAPARERGREQPAWLRDLWHYDPDYPYDVETHEYADGHTTDPYYVREDVLLSPNSLEHIAFLVKANNNLNRFLEVTGSPHFLTQEVLIRDLPAVPGGPGYRPSVAPDIGLWPDRVDRHAPDGFSWQRQGAPRLVVEALSASSREKDLVANPPLYDAMGVEEYWVCDPDTGRWEAVYQRSGDSPLAAVSLKNRDSLYSPVLQTAVRVDPAEGFQCLDPNTGQWVEADASRVAEGRRESRLDYVEERYGPEARQAVGSFLESRAEGESVSFADLDALVEAWREGEELSAWWRSCETDNPTAGDESSLY